MRKTLVSVLVVSALVLASRAEAQYRPERPYRGLFAGGLDDTSQRLTATASLGAGWDQDLIPELVGSTGRQAGRNPEFESLVSTGSAQLSYAVTTDSVGFEATAGTTGRYYPDISSNRFLRRDYANVGLGVPLPGGFAARTSGTYQPYSLLSMFPQLSEARPGEPVPIEEDFPSSTEHYFSYLGGVDYSRRISRRSTFSGGYEYQSRMRSDAAGRWKRQSAGGRVTHELGRSLSVRTGYRYSEIRYSDSRPAAAYHDIDLGVDFNRALSLSLSRRTLLSFSTGASAYRTGRSEALRFRAVGAARLSHEIGRTWSASLAYNRGFSYVDTWVEPVFVDSFTAGVGGLIGKRTQLRFTARALSGAGYSDQYGDIRGVNGNGSLNLALTRYVNTGLSYTYYSQRFTDDFSLTEGFPREFDGQSIRAFVSVWAPLFQRARRP